VFKIVQLIRVVEDGAEKLVVADWPEKFCVGIWGKFMGAGKFLVRVWREILREMGGRKLYTVGVPGNGCKILP
jgi:hypothetical protein